ncbi:MAG TPA: thioredoxin family protein [Verrucomicrobiae bacterium]|nr:thioredoxin family protein [Verrucomicrobiae bacterium]
MEPQHRVVPHDEWVQARTVLLQREKEFTRARDALSEQRRALPWEAVTAPYAFEGAQGRKIFAELFDGRSQLVVYHFMYAPEWEAGCKSCSFWADNFDRIVVHLNHRDVTMAAISRAPYAQLAAYQRRMGWSFPWYSSGGGSFNFDFNVSFDAGAKQATYNYRTIELDGETDLPGISVFYKDADGAIYHTYSAFSRGIDLMNTAYNYLDLTPKGRDEADTPMSWLRRHDEYPSSSA